MQFQVTETFFHFGHIYGRLQHDPEYSIKFCDTDRRSEDISEMSNFHAAEGMEHLMEHLKLKIILGIKSGLNLSQLWVKTAACSTLVAERWFVQE